MMCQSQISAGGNGKKKPGICPVAVAEGAEAKGQGPPAAFAEGWLSDVEVEEVESEADVEIEE